MSWLLKFENQTRKFESKSNSSFCARAGAGMLGTMKRHFFGKIFRAGNAAWFLLLLVLAFNFAIRWRLRDMPLERDEGEFAYAAQLLLQGVSPYDHAYNFALKLPGTCGVYALIMAVLGQTVTAIHTGVILVTSASAILVFILARRICGEAAAVAGAATYVLLAMVPTTLGLAAHATHFVVLCALAGVVLLQKLNDKSSSWRIFLGGVFLGLALVMKQSGAPFCLFGASWIGWLELSRPDRQWRRLAVRLMWLILGGVLPLLGTGIVVALAGDFGSFWFWTVKYAAAHEGIFHWQTGLEWMLANIFDQFLGAPGPWSLAVLGLIASCLWSGLRPWRFFVTSLFIFSFLAVCPGWYFRGHYFIQALSAAALLAAIAFRAMTEFLRRTAFPFPSTVLASIIFAAAMAGVMIQWSGIYFILSPVEACHAIYGTNPFPEAVAISQYVAAHTAPNATVAVLGSEPEIYFYSHRRSASGYMCTYPLVEPQRYAFKMQDQMIHQIEEADPACVVFVNIRGSWVQSTAVVSNSVPGWWKQYSTNYQLAGMVDVNEGHPSQFFWDGQLADRTNNQPPDISIYCRK